jgi:hypothetical protein
MQLPLMELPGDVLNRAIRVMQGVAREADADAVQAERIVRTDWTKAQPPGLLRRSVAAPASAPASLVLAHAGAALFVTALALGAGCARSRRFRHRRRA